MVVFSSLTLCLTCSFISLSLIRLPSTPSSLVMLSMTAFNLSVISCKFFMESVTYGRMVITSWLTLADSWRISRMASLSCAPNCPRWLMLSTSSLTLVMVSAICWSMGTSSTPCTYSPACSGPRLSSPCSTFRYLVPIIPVIPMEKRLPLYSGTPSLTAATTITLPSSIFISFTFPTSTPESFTAALTGRPETSANCTLIS